MVNGDLLNSIEGRMLNELQACFTAHELERCGDNINDLMLTVCCELVLDAEAFAAKDPSSHNDPLLIVESYVSFQAVLSYRIAHFVVNNFPLRRAQKMNIAHKLSGRGKLASGIDIHPSAKIGSRFVIDHGFGTVIGETCVIGDDCYILNGVILGSLGISNNPQASRHPRIGNNVEVGAHARILGPVSIGDAVFISPYSVVVTDVPAQSKVSIVNQLLIQKDSNAKSPSVQPLLAYVKGDLLHILGIQAKEYSLSLLDERLALIEGFSLSRIYSDRAIVEYAINCDHDFVYEVPSQVNLRLCRKGAVSYFMRPVGLSELMRRLMVADVKPRVAQFNSVLT